MNHNDVEKLAQTAWDATADIPYTATQMDHQLRLCSAVVSIEENLSLNKPATTNIAGLEDFEAEVIKRLTALAPAVTRVVTGEGAEKATDKKVVKKK